jgi:desulfoferrodoxin (superoxide reductase-like protein)
MMSLCMLMQASFITSCSDSGGIFSGDEKGKIQKFYSADEPGRWEAQAADHDIQVSIIEDAKGKRGIEVFVPFTKERNEQHYVEAIVLLDEKNRELAKRSFKRGEKAITIFEITDKIKFPVYVVSKCNMHEMWRKKITGK